jgi:hypothetical protein
MTDDDDRIIVEAPLEKLQLLAKLQRQVAEKRKRIADRQAEIATNAPDA